MSVNKPTLFISYCQRDGNSYADDLETELVDYFVVKRDKTKLIPNDDIYNFMAGIANEDFVVIVLTSGYVKSLNCMLEMAYLSAQPDWSEKTMVLVIDESLYDTGKKIEILEHWRYRQQKACVLREKTHIGKSILEQEKEYLDQINAQLEGFLMGLTRRLNPSQIAIVNELVRKLKETQIENEQVLKGEQFIKEFLEEHGSKTISEISMDSGYSKATVSRYIRKLLDSDQIVAQGSNKNREYALKKD